VLWYTNPGKPPALLPLTPGGDPQTRVLDPGGHATAFVTWVDGYGGYASSAPECHQVVQYHGLALAVGPGRIEVPGVTMDVQCGTIFSYWQ
jgi:hypothetical protein